MPVIHQEDKKTANTRAEIPLEDKTIVLTHTPIPRKKSSDRDWFVQLRVVKVKSIRLRNQNLSSGGPSKRTSAFWIH